MDLPPWQIPGLNFPLDWESAAQVSQNIQDGAQMEDDIFATDRKEIIYERVMESDRPHYLVVWALSNWTTQVDDWFFTLYHNKQWMIPESDDSYPSDQEQWAQREHWNRLQERFRVDRTEKRIEHVNKRMVPHL